MFASADILATGFRQNFCSDMESPSSKLNINFAQAVDT